tara:strand:- start:1358 stop:2548 length:1191 start_codon:yes stop_codon:yes gene_type:complete
LNNHQAFPDKYNCNFDLKINRAQSCSLKYDGRQDMFGNASVIPLWVADMDFAAPAAVTRALSQRSTHPIYGYTLYPDSLYESLIDWLACHHGWRDVHRDWIVMCPGVVPSLHASSIAFSKPNELIIVQPPVYFPFFSAVSTTGRNLVLNPLRIQNKRYTINFDQLEEHAKRAKILFLCSPHNPVGRVWSEEELKNIIKISKKHDLIIFSDEIHADLVFSENKHKMLAVLAEDPSNIITAVAPSKTFNIPGLNLSALIVPNKRHRNLITKAFETLHISSSNPFSIVAFEAAYKEGGPWLLKLLSYLQDTRDFVEQYLRDYLPEIRLIKPDATYLLWLDCRKLGMNDTELHNFFVHKAGVGMSPGTIFGEGGSGFMRMNIGMPRHIIATALANIKDAF